MLKPLTTEALDSDGCWMDGHGVIFSADKRKIIKCPNRFSAYPIPPGTKVICNSAFYGCTFLTSITIPNSVT